VRTSGYGGAHRYWPCLQWVCFNHVRVCAQNLYLTRYAHEENRKEAYYIYYNWRIGAHTRTPLTETAIQWPDSTCASTDPHVRTGAHIYQWGETMTYYARPTGRTFYPDSLKERNWWVNWVLAVRREDMDGDVPTEDAKPTKQPVAPYDNGTAKPCKWNSGIPEDEHPRTAFENVKKWDSWSVGTDVPAPDRVVSDELGIGIITPVGGGNGDTVTLLDWDDVRIPETGEVHPVCAKALTESDGYAEVSQSGEGIHQFVFGEIPGGFSKFLRHIDDEPFVGDDLPMVEMYCSGRLTAMTGNHVKVVSDA